MKTAIKIGCVVLGTLALAGTVTYFVCKRPRGVEIKVKENDFPKTNTPSASLSSEEYVKRLKERKRAQTM